MSTLSPQPCIYVLRPHGKRHLLDPINASRVSTLPSFSILVQIVTSAEGVDFQTQRLSAGDTETTLWSRILALKLIAHLFTFLCPAQIQEDLIASPLPLCFEAQSVGSTAFHKKFRSSPLDPYRMGHVLRRTLDTA